MTRPDATSPMMLPTTQQINETISTRRSSSRCWISVMRRSSQSAAGLGSVSGSGATKRGRSLIRWCSCQGRRQSRGRGGSGLGGLGRRGWSRRRDRRGGLDGLDGAGGRGVGGGDRGGGALVGLVDLFLEGVTHLGGGLSELLDRFAQARTQLRQP